jgi:ParB family chromosome partitioning protein
LLRQLQASEYPAIRLAAARAAAKEAGAEWLAVVRDLTRDSDPDIRRQAAELIALHDPDLAKATLEPLLNDPNPAMRQAAADSYVTSTGDIAALRRYLRDTDSGTRVKAADRVLQLTR